MSFSHADLPELVRRGLVVSPKDAHMRTGAPIEAPESDLQARVRRLARESGWLVYHTRDSRGSDKGFPDLVLCRPGSLLFIELKSAAGKLSAEQATWIDLLRHSVPDVEAYLWRPADWPEIQQRLLRG
jgi:hypothetical protein